MVPFKKHTGLPTHLAHWQATVDDMLSGIAWEGTIYLMIDQGKVGAGETHRRPGLHIDGYWVPAKGKHGSHKSGPSIYGAHVTEPFTKFMNNDDWGGAAFEQSEDIILASNVQAVRGFSGKFNGPVGTGGDCVHVDTSGMDEIILQAGVAYRGNVTFLHESLPVKSDCLRTVVRLNLSILDE
jgi:hypothetical protein